MPFQAPMQTVKVAYFYELKTHLGMSEIILWPSAIKISNKTSGQSERALANRKDFKVGDNLFA